ncbi:MAG: hypothetical protein GWN00_15615, partial [Aliifodinibius sp.]|nr:hypothetical protein [Fodinibius sp.]NIV12491.1 hypothetical protein [Fodinibius sp.]NIY26179.1 hypothetical protein [Fodinibius sp.]
MGIFGDSDASDAIKKAQEEYMQYLEKALGELRQSRLQGRTDIIGYAQPYLTAGKTGLAAYMASLGLGPTGGAGQQTSADRFRASPGYQFMMQQGINALSSANAARGMTGSGAAAMALQRYGQGLAQQEYGGYQQRLAGLAGMGQQTSMQTGQELGSLGLGYAGDISGLYSAMGQSQASAA